MSKYQAEDSHAKTVERLLHARDFGHLRARKYGITVIVESAPRSGDRRLQSLSRQSK